MDSSALATAWTTPSRGRLTSAPCAARWRWPRAAAIALLWMQLARCTCGAATPTPSCISRHRRRMRLHRSRSSRPSRLCAAAGRIPSLLPRTPMVSRRSIAGVATSTTSSARQRRQVGSGSSCRRARSNAYVDKATLVQQPLRFPTPVLAVASVASGWKHSLLATSDGRVFAWGHGRSGELGLGPATLRAPTPTVVPIDGAVAAVYCGWQHSVFHLTSKGLAVAGSNRHGQLGLRNERRQQVFEPTPILEADVAAPFRCDLVAVGWHHVVGVRDGAVFSWGKGSFGQLGHGGVDAERTPRRLVMDERIDHVACGSEHSLLVAASGRLYSCGWGEHGNLGHGDTQSVARPTAIAYFDMHRLRVFSAVAAGATSFAMATSQRT
ncbi:hypothetical protein SPRG_13112 [Saprolegnia parasitica CBS 223.65]|uniref:RCC1-like domain-containing protein n=1 Tax=Saprolegnia parasitica (strain CBS 223.65) TaxID=695850 RepID=A0A067BYK3_SAPPC|nr:hypothetical protein SPRG_13112 [Saprolegnia parasitica CBS 223.65]KDO21930.1 hypothetical protein SPRG_13112 [Saprolegnia parasitica CBS 223.65]|eukprot:XP_012207371.1 hypothetical protein SPRG_13112 [Saprolegnia parasitica CBS 223.65]